MIAQIGSGEALPPHPGMNPVLLAKISTLFALYAHLPQLALFYRIEDTAIAALCGGALTVTGRVEDTSELAALIRMLGARSVSCEGALAVSLQAALGATSRTLLWLHCTLPPAPQSGADLCREPAFGEMYRLLHTHLPGFAQSCPERDGWVSDISRRYYSAHARMACTRHDGALTAAALISAVSHEIELIGALCVHPLHRGGGIGGRLLAQLTREAQECGRQTAIVCERALLGYYGQCGFALQGEITELIL